MQKQCGAFPLASLCILPNPFLSCSFWTSTRSPATSKSNPPLFLTPFGLLHALPPLPSPICRSFSPLLDFLLLHRHFQVQSAALSYSFWTFSVSPAVSKSNPCNFTLPRCSHFSNQQKKKAMPVYYHQHCSIRYIFNLALISSIS